MGTFDGLGVSFWYSVKYFMYVVGCYDTWKESQLVQLLFDFRGHRHNISDFELGRKVVMEFMGYYVHKLFEGE